MVDYLTAIFLFITGSAIGSFLNVCIDRLPNDKPITGRSHCDYCKKKLKSIDLLPIISFVLLRGRCRYCKRKLSLQYPLVELLTGVMFILTWFIIPAKTEVVRILNLGIVATLIAIFFADLKYQIIPDELQLIFFILALTVAGINSDLRLDFLYGKAIDGLLVMLPILFLYLVTRGRGMGFGDVKYAFVAGFLLRLYGGLVALYIAFVVGALVGIVLLVFKLKKLKSQIAFGPFLVIGTMVVMFFPAAVYYNFFYLLNSWKLLH